MKWLKQTFDSPVERFIWLGLVALGLPLGVCLRVYQLQTPLVEVHPIRQLQTALTTQQLYQGTATVWDYRSPLEGKLWNNVYEFPFYQWICAQQMKWGATLEQASRLTTLAFFFLSLFALVSLTQLLLGRRHAAWSALFYFISPFSILYSRVALIDFAALSFSLLSLLSFVHLWRNPKTLWPSVCFCLWGSLAVLQKSTVWFAPALACGLFAFFKLLTSEQKNRALLAIALLAIQAGVGLLWMVHASHLRSSEEPLFWIFGTLDQRMQWEWWDRALSPIVRLLLHDWLVIPFVMGIVYLFRRPNALLLGCLGLGLLPVAITFNVHAYHDYYLIGELPYLMGVVAVGMVSLFSLSRNLQVVLLSCMGVVLSYKIVHWRGALETVVHDFSGVSQIAEAKNLKALTTQEELIFYDKPSQSYEYAVYSERKVGLRPAQPLLEPLASDPKAFSPSVFWIQPESVALVAHYPAVWIDALSPSYFVYRVKESGAFIFDGSRQIAIFQKRASNVDFILESYLAVDLCEQSKPSFLISVSETQTPLKLVADNTKEPLWLPPGRTLSLPSRSIWGCHYQVSYGSRSYL